MVQMGAMHLDRARLDLGAVNDNPFFLPDAGAVQAWSDYLDGIRKDQNSVGAAIEVCVQGCPPGLGAPVYAKLDTDLAAAMMSINAVKAVEIGEGMASAALTGVANADEIRMGRTGRSSCRTMQAGFWAGFPRVRTSSCVSRSSRPARSPRPADRSTHAERRST